MLSEEEARSVLNVLEKDGWIKLHPETEKWPMKSVSLTEKSMVLFHLFFGELRGGLDMISSHSQETAIERMRTL